MADPSDTAPVLPPTDVASPSDALMVLLLDVEAKGKASSAANIAAQAAAEASVQAQAAFVAMHADFMAAKEALETAVANLAD